MHVRSIHSWIDKPVVAAPLVVFRIVFGLVMCYSTLRFTLRGWIEDHYLAPSFHFKYFGFHWVEVLPAFWMYAIHIVMMLAALCVCVGWYYRAAAWMLFFTFTYAELIDVSYYLNHYYFVSIICGLMAIVPAHLQFSLDVLRRPACRSATVPGWSILAIQLQVAIVYVYAGLAKINTDWLLHALPLKIWLPAKDEIPALGELLAHPITPYLFSWLGMLFDCTIVIWLSWRRTRLWAYGAVIVFHAFTGIVFQIGVFPWIMVAAASIFLPSQWHEVILRKLTTIFPSAVTHKLQNFDIAPRQELPEARLQRRPFLKWMLISFFVFQLLFPWRYLLYPGNLFWTEEGFRFSWRVMLIEKAGTATFYVKDAHTDREGIVFNSKFLNSQQEKQMTTQPDMILQFAHFLKDWYAAHGMTDPAVRAEVYVTLNARPSMLLIDPQIDLSKIEDGWAHKKWILPDE